MKIISLNAWTGKQGELLWEYIQKQKEDTDVFLLQEANGYMETIRTEELKGWPSLSAYKLESTTGEELAQSTIYRGEMELVVAGTFHTTNKCGFGLWTEIQFRGETYTFCNIHGVSMPADKLDNDVRIDQSKQILAFLKDRPGKHIIMGDFNLFPETESIQLFERAGYRNLIKEYEIETTRNEVAWASWPDNKQLWADYAFVSPDIKVVDFQVPKNEVSDHLPMELIIE
jgi:endonuclease/exonuclease/phosphatase family metal-dependent hydrolase